MLNKYIKELVETNNRVIVPEFGAFMVQDTTEGKQISFNDFLKFNDGLLANQIIKAERIGKAEATEQIKGFIKQIEESFSAGKPFFIEPLGYLSKDSHGNIKFEMATKVASEAPKTTIEKPAVPEIKTPIIIDEPITPAEPIKQTPEPEAKPQAPVSAPVMPKSEPVSKPSLSKPTLSNTKSQNQKPKPMATSSNSNNNTNLIIVLASVVIILGGLTWAAFALGWFGLGEGAKQHEIVVNETPAVDSTALMVDTLPEPKVVEEPVVDVQATKKYYIIAGSFKVPSNAERFNKKLIGEGYPSQIVVRSNGFHTVSYNQYATWKEALSNWRQMRESNPETWILVK